MINNNDSFIRIKTLFTTPEQRKVPVLSKVYDDHEKLILYIRSIMGERFLSSVKGKKVFIKPNWVMHLRRENEEICLHTHHNFLIAALTAVLDAEPSMVTIGDAPVQGCSWKLLLNDAFYKRIDNLKDSYRIPIEIKDFRRVTFDIQTQEVKKDQHPLSEYLIFDLGENSYLEPVTDEKKDRFRVGKYDPKELSHNHRKGVHRYCIIKDLFEADIVINMPKIKTHQKTGMTGALKNLVGVNGEKAYLPHHMFGGTAIGGDCYPGKNLFLHLSEKCADKAFPKRTKRNYDVLFWTYLGVLFRELSCIKKDCRLSGSWHGNDTCWRMVFDLNKIAVYGKIDGTLSDTPQRNLYSLCDGIIGGQGDGPLSPVPLPLGIISFTNNSALNDVCMSTLMQYDLDKLNITRNAFKLIKDESSYTIYLDDNIITLSDLLQWSIPVVPPPGWEDCIL